MAEHDVYVTGIGATTPLGGDVASTWAGMLEGRSGVRSLDDEWAKDFPKWASDNKAPFFTPQTSAAMTDWLMDQMLATPVPVVIASFKALIGADVRPDLAKVDRPTLILQGTKDASAPLEITGRRVAAGVKGAELKVYDGAPHGLFVTHMERLNADLLAFIRGGR